MLKTYFDNIPEGLITLLIILNAQYHYDPWGNQIFYSGNLSQSIRYAGYYYDEETGLYYLKSRYYSPTLGRFLTKDRYGFISHSDPQTLNLYTYCGNNPVNRTDPSGNGYVWNDYGEVIGTTPGDDYTDTSQEALDTHGGSHMANTPWDGDSSNNSRKKVIYLAYGGDLTSLYDNPNDLANYPYYQYIPELGSVFYKIK